MSSGQCQYLLASASPKMPEFFIFTTGHLIISLSFIQNYLDNQF